MESYPEAKMPFEQRRTSIHGAALCDFSDKLDLLCTDIFLRHQLRSPASLKL